MYVIKGIIFNTMCYYVNSYFDKNIGMEIRKMSETIEGATHYDSIEEVQNICDELHTDALKIYPVCPRCHRDYDGYPAISRKDNKTKICSKCGNQEAIFDFMKNIIKE